MKDESLLMKVLFSFILPPYAFILALPAPALSTRFPSFDSRLIRYFHKQLLGAAMKRRVQ